MPRPIASRMGKPNDQNNASGSRVYSLKRTVMSCQSELAPSPCSVRSLIRGSLIAQLSPGERDEAILQRRGMCRQVRELDSPARDQSQQRRYRPMQLADLELV